MIKTHNKTNQKFLFITCNRLVSTLYVLDKSNNKVPEKNNKGKHLLDADGNKRYKLAICLNKNLL
jgi:hypothetical protein